MLVPVCFLARLPDSPGAPVTEAGYLAPKTAHYYISNPSIPHPCTPVDMEKSKHLRESKSQSTYLVKGVIDGAVEGPANRLTGSMHSGEGSLHTAGCVAGPAGCRCA